MQRVWVDFLSLFFFLYPGSSVRSFTGKSEYSRHPVCAQHNASLPLLFIRIKWAITKNPEVCVVSPSLPLSLSLFSGNKKKGKGQRFAPASLSKSTVRLVSRRGCVRVRLQPEEGDCWPFRKERAIPLLPRAQEAVSQQPLPRNKQNTSSPPKKNQNTNTKQNRKRHKSARRGGRVLPTATRAGASSSRARLSPQ